MQSKCRIIVSSDILATANVWKMKQLMQSQCFTTSSCYVLCSSVMTLVQDLAWCVVSGSGRSLGLIFLLRSRVVLFGLISIMLLWIVYFPCLAHSISLRFICWDWPTAPLAKRLFSSVIRYLLPSLTSLPYRLIPPSCCWKSCWSEFSQPHSGSEMRQIKAQLHVGARQQRVTLLVVFYSLNELVSHHWHAGLIRQHIRVQRKLQGDPHLGTAGY